MDKERSVTMHFVQNLSIKRELTLIIMATSAVALVLACAVFAIYDWFTFRQTMTRDLSTLAEVLGANSTAALTFSDQRAAGETLATLSAKSHIVSACLYTTDGQVFAIYRRSDQREEFSPLAPQPEGSQFTNAHLELFHHIKLDGEVAGTLYLRSDLQEMNARLKG